MAVQASPRQLGGPTLERHLLHHLDCALSSNRNYYISQRLRTEPCLAVGEVILPFPPERLNIFLAHDLSPLFAVAEQRGPDVFVEILHEIFAPEPQRFCVMRADVLDVVDDQRFAAPGVDGGNELGNGGEMAAGEDVAADEIIRGGVGIIALK